MKRFAAALTALVLALCLSPCAYALVTLEKPDKAQMVYLPADDYESYRADFYLSALTAIERDGDDLRLLFPSSRIVLRGFFATNDTRRALEARIRQAVDEANRITRAELDARNALERTRRALAESEARRQSAAETHARLTEEGVRLQAAFARLLSENEFADEADYRLARLPENQVRELEARITAHNENRCSLADRIDKKIVVRKHLWGAQATIEA